MEQRERKNLDLEIISELDLQELSPLLIATCETTSFLNELMLLNHLNRQKSREIICVEMTPRFEFNKLSLKVKFEASVMKITASDVHLHKMSVTNIYSFIQCVNRLLGFSFD